METAISAGDGAKSKADLRDIFARPNRSLAESSRSAEWHQLARADALRKTVMGVAAPRPAVQSNTYS